MGGENEKILRENIIIRNSFKLSFSGSEIWCEELDAMNIYIDIAVEKFLKDMEVNRRTFSPWLIAIHLNETLVKKAFAEVITEQLKSAEDGLSAAYRELEEETAITKNDIMLTYLMDFTYYLSNIKLEVYVGRINKEISVHGDENDLECIEINQNFLSMLPFSSDATKAIRQSK
jgi:hypothetical protein